MDSLKTTSYVWLKSIVKILQNGKTWSQPPTFLKQKHVSRANYLHEGLQKAFDLARWETLYLS